MNKLRVSMLHVSAVFDHISRGPISGALKKYLPFQIVIDSTDEYAAVLELESGQAILAIELDYVFSTPQFSRYRSGDPETREIANLVALGPTQS